MFVPVKINPVSGGQQKIYRFPNGYGASVVKHWYSYGGNRGLWELAVIIFDGEGEELGFELCYSTPVTDDVLGYLNDEAVNDNLKLISELISELEGMK